MNNMEAKELRIGNYVQSKGHLVKDGNAISKVCGIQLNNNINCTGINWDGTTINAEPIPLTEEWLVKFGFEIDFYGGQGNVTYYAKKGKFKIYSIEDDKSYQYDWTKNMFIMINHVHQLQNLYYSLTQKELIWKKYI